MEPQQFGGNTNTNTNTNSIKRIDTSDSSDISDWSVSSRGW